MRRRSSNTAASRWLRSAAAASLDDLQKNTPADGLITGTGLVHASEFRTRARALRGDDLLTTVLGARRHAGQQHHRKSDRLLGLAAEHKLPFVLFAEGGGGRPGDVDSPSVSGLHCTTFRALAALSGQVPTLGIVEGYCFAGNAALLGSCTTT